VDLDAERHHGEFVRELIADGRITAAHDVSDGGVLVALAEMAMASGLGCEVDLVDAANAFGEDQARYIVTGRAWDTIEAAGVPVVQIGTTGGFSVKGPGFDVPVKVLREANERFFKEWMEA
jgi:phosphoribosylformylglycinamidine synthase